MRLGFPPCIIRSKIQGGEEEEARRSHFVSVRILLSTSACRASGCSLLFQSEIMCDLVAQSASAITSMCMYYHNYIMRMEKKKAERDGRT